MIEKLLDAFEMAITLDSPEECARQFMLWVNHVSSALFASGLKQEYEVWTDAAKHIHFYADDNSFPAQAESMQAILLGVLSNLPSESGFVAHERIQELRNLTSAKFYFGKLIKLCAEINSLYNSQYHLQLRC